MENILRLVSKYYDILLASILVISITALYLSMVSRRSKDAKSYIPGSLGIPFVGETFALISATNSVKGCYDFVRLRREHGKWFKPRIFGKVHVFVPSVEGAKAIFTSDFALFNKGYVKSMADAVGKKSLLCVPHESHKRIRRLLSDPFSMNSLSKFVQRFDNMLCERLKKVQKEGKSFTVLDFNMKITFAAMCDMLMSIKDASLLKQIEKNCTAVSDAMLSFPVMIQGTRYYKGIKVVKEALRMSNVLLWYPRVALDDCTIEGKFVRSTLLHTNNSL
ncbi:hypothetical protein RND71_011869 [Anisodus tanguticus]|uniref:Cytochrome P450 n=1 Tax=Anisodus tanguticus TaxID=243964 RepID=A0AAE1VGG2_9SOLA|nr:hypothetical protein RND71_011869 [Anisodus tanguticus]